MRGQHFDLTKSLGRHDFPVCALPTIRIAIASFVTVATSAYFALHGPPNVPAELGGHRCTAFAPMREIRLWRYQLDGVPIVHHPRGHLRTADAELECAAVLAVAPISAFYPSAMELNHAL